MERKVGEVFEFEGKKIKVIKGNHPDCEGCFFKEKVCNEKKEIIGYCTWFKRSKNDDVIFKEINESDDMEVKKIISVKEATEIAKLKFQKAIEEFKKLNNNKKIEVKED